ncbi:uncharacterized protein J3D65DRAFT_329554 [Phyllosticta citribraziliensis]|uniref:Uncharacterized protein n=1 Tax=Phyllosticta citribraziliensis TaxID=989973 RepID=A0ABR1LTK3_9PEZI
MRSGKEGGTLYLLSCASTTAISVWSGVPGCTRPGGICERLHTWTVDCGLWTVDCGLWTVDCGLRTADCGLRSMCLPLHRPQVLPSRALNASRHEPRMLPLRALNAPFTSLECSLRALEWSLNSHQVLPSRSSNAPASNAPCP